MKEKGIVGIYRCPGCERFCVGVSRAAAELHIATCAAYVASLELADLENRTNDTPETLTARYNTCGACGTPSIKFLPAKIEDFPQSTTLQAVIAPPFADQHSQNPHARQKSWTYTPLPNGTVILRIKDKSFTNLRGMLTPAPGTQVDIDKMSLGKN